VPGQLPRYQPNFSRADRRQAAEVVRKHRSPQSLARRARLALEIARNPAASAPELAGKVGLHPETVRKWRKRWATEPFSLNDKPRSGRPKSFSPRVVAQAKAIACELPGRRKLPWSRFSVREVRRVLQAEGHVKKVSVPTVWRWLDADALRPWRHRVWIFPRDPDFGRKGGVVVDLYQGIWEGRPLGPGCYVISADEKTSIQARSRCHRPLPTESGRAMRVEHEYVRHGAVAYLAALDVGRGTVMGHVAPGTGIEPFEALVNRVMTREPYASAERVFWVVDNGSSHRPTTFPARLSELYPNAVAVHLPIHASWLNQIEIYFSIVQRKVLTPNDFADLGALKSALLRFEKDYNRQAKPFAWNFTRDKLASWLKQLKTVA